jgi:hypothetical protein
MLFQCFLIKINFNFNADKNLIFPKSSFNIWRQSPGLNFGLQRQIFKFFTSR